MKRNYGKVPQGSVTAYDQAMKDAGKPVGNLTPEHAKSHEQFTAADR